MERKCENWDAAIDGSGSINERAGSTVIGFKGNKQPYVMPYWMWINEFMWADFEGVVTDGRLTSC